jgi:hypothetical protein
MVPLVKALRELLHQSTRMSTFPSKERRNSFCLTTPIIFLDIIHRPVHSEKTTFLKMHSVSMFKFDLSIWDQ